MLPVAEIRSGWFLTACSAVRAQANRVIVEGSLPLTSATIPSFLTALKLRRFFAPAPPAAAALTLRRTDPRLADPVLNALTESGCRISAPHDTIQIFATARWQLCGPVVSRPHPAFQPTRCRCCSPRSCAQGTNVLTETILKIASAGPKNSKSLARGCIRTEAPSV